jgi:RHS repeat-associated protein
MKTTKRLVHVGTIASLMLTLMVLAETPFRVNPPTFPDTNTLRLTLSDAATNVAFSIYATPDVNDGFVWTPVTTGTVGQLSFDFTIPTNSMMFFRASYPPPPATLKVATPVANPGGGSYTWPTNVTITCATEGASIYYTTNGATPTVSDVFIYSGNSVYVASSITLKVRAFKPGYDDSDIVTNSYTINAPPYVSAGPQQVLGSSSTTLQGIVADDGLTGGGTRFTNWSKITGTGSVTFGNANQTNTSVTFGANGIYVLQLAASDGQYTNSSQVTIGVNPTLTVTLTSPTGGSTFTVPTNLLLQAAASTTSGSVTQVAFYAGATLIGRVTATPYNFEWRDVPVGSHALTAVATTSDPNNLSLASTPANITVNWPTNVGQFSLALTDLEIPVPGELIRVQRLYDTRFGSAGSFGQNWKLDYEGIQIQADPLSDGWEGYVSITYCVRATESHLVTVSLSEDEKYYFYPRVVFPRSSSSCVNVSSPAGCLADEPVRYEFSPVPGGEGQLTLSQPSTIRLWDYEDGYTGPMLVATLAEDEFGFCEATAYEPPLSNYTFTAPDGVQYRFDSNGKLYQRIDRNGNALTYTSTSITYSNAAVSGSTKQVTFTRDGSNRITEIYDPIAIQTSGQPALKYAYDGSGNLTSFQRLLNRAAATYETTTYSYTNASFPNHITQISGSCCAADVRNDYDTIGRLIRQYDGLNNISSYAYDLTGRRYYVTNRLGGVSIRVFYDSGLPQSDINPLGGVKTFTYDDEGRRIQQTDELGRTTSYAFDQNDNLVALTNRLGFTTRFTHDQYRQILTSVDALGRGATNGYDAKGNLVAVTNALGFVTRYAYDAQGNRTAETNALSQVTRWQYDSFGNLTNVVDAIGNTNRYSADANGNATGLTDGLGRTTQFVYDGINRLVRTVFPDSTATGIGYNHRNQKLYETNQSGVVTAYGYDAAGRLVATTNAFGTANQIVTQYGYDPEGHLTAYIDALARTNRFLYDAMGRRTRRTLPLEPGGLSLEPSYSESFTYDAVGNLTRQTDFNGRTTTRGFDAEGRLIARTNASEAVVTYAYDPNGLRTNMTDASGVTSYFYDDAQRLTEKVTPQGTLNYTYDNADRLLTTVSSTPNGTAVTNKWSASGQLTNVIDRFNNTTRYDYDAAANLLRVRYANGVTNTYSYDSLNRLTNLVAAKTGSTLARFSYKLAATGHRTNLTELNGRTVGYAYNSLDRLTSEVISSDPSGLNGTVSYALDAVGNRTNRTSSVPGIASATSTFDLNDRISGESFDKNGNVITNASGQRLDYDSNDRLTNFNNGAVIIVYDGDGNRVRKTVGGVTTLYLVDELNPTGFAQVLEELSATNSTPLRLYTYGMSLVSQRASNGTTHYYGYDGVGSIRFLTDTSANLSDTYVYDAYGVVITNTGTTTNFYRYAGEQFDPDLGIYYLRSRYLNQTQGRFLTLDRLHGLPITDPKLHPYLYADGDPVQNSDPTGLQSSSEQITVTGIQGGLAAQRVTATARAIRVVKQSVCKITSGVYIFRNASTGLRYVGQSKHILKRLQYHMRKGNLSIDQFENVLIALIEGDSKLQREIIEQLFMDDLKKQGPLQNIRDPIGGRPQYRLRVCK